MGSESTQQQAKVVFSGDLVLARSLALGEELGRALKSDRVEISFGVVGNVDLAFLQVLCAARRTAQMGGKEIGVGGDIPAAVSDLVRHTGLYQETGSEEDRFWGPLASVQKGEG